MVDELTAMFRVCMHIKGSGDRCNSPAMKGMNFCYHHIGGKVASLVREGATYDASAQLDFDYPADRESIQQNMFLVAQALREGKIDNPTANTYIRIFRACEQNLHRWEKKQKTTGKTKMPPPANEATNADANNNNAGTNTKPDVILSEAQRSGAESKDLRFPPPPQHPQPGAPCLASETWERCSTTNDVIPTEANPNNDLSFRAQRTGVPGTPDVRVLGRETEEPALPPAPPKTLVSPAGAPCLAAETWERCSTNNVIPTEARNLRFASGVTTTEPLSPAHTYPCLPTPGAVACGSPACGQNKS